MKRIILTLTFVIVSIFAFGQTTVNNTTDDFGNYVQIENQIETTHFSILGQDAMFRVNNGKVGLFSTKYSISLPGQNRLNDTYMPWDRLMNVLNIDEKNLNKLYDSITNKKDVKISGAKVFASNKIANAKRVNIEIQVKLYEEENNSYIRFYIFQQSYMNQSPALDQLWILDESDAKQLTNVISKYITSK